MHIFNTYGISRSIEPRGSLPQPAWKLDNTMELGPDELLIDVKIVSINLVSFLEIGEETEFNEELFKRRVLEIIRERGKLHNPVTGTGGMLYGRVRKMGAQYPNHYHIRTGDNIISLTSLSITPMRLEKILSVDYESAQLEVVGQCILFASSPLMKKPDELPLKILIAAMDEAGAPTRTYRTVEKGQDILVMGASGKLGLLCACAAKDKLGDTGRLVGLVRGQENKQKMERSGLFGEVLDTDSTSVAKLLDNTMRERIFERFDVVINCINSPSTELAALMAVRHGGTVFFASLSCDYKLTSLTAEGIGKQVDIIPYTGFIEGHADYTLQLLKKFSQLREFLQFKRASGGMEHSGEVYASADYQQDEPVGNTEGYIFCSKESKATLRQALKVARYNSNVMIYGESGVGKEIIARIIHQNSERRSFPMIKINCAAIPEHLLESELFGYEKGSFTGASAKGKVGLWEAAQNGTLFLDEVGELPISFQAKLLRVIQEKEIIRVGGVSPIKVDVRIVAATNRDLTEMIRSRLFREDLYYRLNVFPLTVLPLRKRRSDIIPLADYFVQRYNQEFGMNKTLGTQAQNFLSNQPFRGNIRELQNLIQRLMITTGHEVINVKDILQAMACDQKDIGEIAAQVRLLPSAGQQEPDDDETASLKELMGRTEASILRRYKEKYKSTRKMAEALGISQPSVVRKLNQYGIGDDEP